jgi:hypothetical protein
MCTKAGTPTISPRMSLSRPVRRLKRFLRRLEGREGDTPPAEAGGVYDGTEEELMAVPGLGLDDPAGDYAPRLSQND